jgi:hypothetical protein
VTAPGGSVVTVSPEVLVFRLKNEKQSYTVSIGYKGNKTKEVSFGDLVWVEENGNHKVRSPIVVSPMFSFLCIHNYIYTLITIFIFQLFL